MSVEVLNPILHALIELLPAPSVTSGRLSGWTFAIKDNTDIQGVAKTDGLGPPLPRPAVRDAEVVRRLRAAGATIVGTANLEELSFGATTQNPVWGACRNPWDLQRIPGGSSGGSAVAVAAGLVRAALGTDTGGSLRNPAAFCGVSALRPSHGLVPTLGVTPLSPSMDVVGPIAQSVEDLGTVLEVLVGGPLRPAAGDLAGLAVGVPSTYFLDDLEPAVAHGFDAFLELLTRCGARIVVLTDLGDVDAVHAAMAALQNSEAVRGLQPYWDDPRVSDGIRGRIEAGRAVTTDEIEKAAAVAARWRTAVDNALQDVDVIAVPATPFVAPVAAADDLTQLSRRINRLTGSWSLTGTPVLALPTAPAPSGLPVGVQLVGGRGADGRVLAIGERIQRESDWHLRSPDVLGQVSRAAT
ncbi:amidase [Kribbella sp. NPDC048928]|uniref:amidase n=1 Tax=Kribbella sp. NPDC048928 TaxID=3364111 RepID=UPI00371FCD6C